MITVLLGIAAAFAQTSTTVEVQLDAVAQRINGPHEGGGFDFRNAVVVGHTLYADVVIAKPVLLPPDVIPHYVQIAVCANKVMRDIVSDPSVELRFSVSAPNWAEAVTAPVRAADCDETSPIRTAPVATASPRSPIATITAKERAPSFDFKGVPLGISYDEFRGLSHPDGSPARVVCTGDKVAVGVLSTEAWQVAIYDEAEKALGVRKCIWLGTGGIDAGSSMPLDVAGTGYIVTKYSFDFVPDPEDGILRLYLFAGQTSTDVADVVMSAFSSKYGKPKLTTGTVQNGLGNRFRQVTAAWVDETGALIVRSPDVSTDKMTITMADTRLLEFVEDQVSANRAALSNGL